MIDRRHGSADDDNDVLWMLLGVRSLIRGAEAHGARLDRSRIRAVVAPDDEVLLAILGAVSVLRRVDAVTGRAAAHATDSVRLVAPLPDPDHAAHRTPRELLR